MVPLLVLFLCSFLRASGQQQSTQPAANHFTRILLDLGDNLGQHVRDRLRSHVAAVDSVEVVESLDQLLRPTSHPEEKSLLLSLGNSSYW